MAYCADFNIFKPQKKEKKVKDKRCTIVFFFDVFTVVVRCLVL